MTDHKILIIEDDDFLRSLESTKLKKAGFIVDIATDGKTGLDKLRVEMPHLILLDLMLPNVDGFQVLETLKTEGLLEKSKVIVFSNLGSDEDINKVKPYNVAAYIIKSSFTLDELVEKIAATLK